MIGACNAIKIIIPIMYLITIQAVLFYFIIINSKVDVNSLARIKQDTKDIAHRAPLGNDDPMSKTNPENAQIRNKVVRLTIPLANLPR
jgi:hypothetical protein